jgi:PPK2 family polyphosphate:nucleotide phosphotransferase
MTMAETLSDQFRITNGKGFDLSSIDTRDTCGLKDKDEAKLRTEEDASKIDELQNRLFAEGKRSLLVILQGIDCSGKDGTVRSVFNTCGPIGVHVQPFKAPTDVELAHDYLWRVHQVAPARGYIGIFNRSHYEDVLVVKVRKFAPADVIEKRYDQINAFERMLSESGTRVLKFMLHISKDEQAERLKDRIEDPAKRWKFNPSDLEDRKIWDDFMEAYQVMVRRCATDHAPWHVIPSDRKWVRSAIIARIVRETLEEMNPQYPEAKGWDPAKIVIV